MTFHVPGLWTVPPRTLRLSRKQLVWAGSALVLILLGAVLVPLAVAASRPAGATGTGAGALEPVGTFGGPVPEVPSGLPADLEPAATYVPQVSCDPGARRGGRALGRLLTETYRGTTAGLVRACGADGGSSPSEHYDGRAVDWMLPGTMKARRARARAFLGWLLAPDGKGRKYAMARRLGIMYVIWDKKIFGLYRAGEGWRDYRCSGVTGCHQDHVHISLSWEGALGRTSYWSSAPGGRKVAARNYGPCRVSGFNWAPPYGGPRRKPCPDLPRVRAPAGASATRAALVRYSGAEIRQGFTGPIVSAVQRALLLRPDGSFGAGTRAAVIAYQRRHGITRTGIVGPRTWQSLIATTR